MPNDDVFAGTTTTPSPAPTQTTATPAPSGTPATPALTSDDLKVAFQGFANELREALAASAPAPAPKAPPSEDDWQNKFFQAPRDTIRDEVNQSTAETVALFAKAQAETMLDSMSEKFDGEFGHGAWDQFVRPRIEPAVKQALQTRPLDLVNRQMIENSIKTIKGENFDALYKHREEYRGKTSAAREAEETARMERIRKELPGLTGGYRLTTTDGKTTLDDDGKAFLQHYYKTTGERLNEDELLATLNSGTSYDDWKAAMSKTKTASAKTA